MLGTVGSVSTEDAITSRADTPRRRLQVVVRERGGQERRGETEAMGRRRGEVLLLRNL